MTAAQTENAWFRERLYQMRDRAEELRLDVDVIRLIHELMEALDRELELLD